MYFLLQDINRQINNLPCGPCFKAAQILSCCVFQSPIQSQRQAREQLYIYFIALQKANNPKLVESEDRKECGHSHLLGPRSSVSAFLGLGFISPAFRCPHHGYLLKD